MKTHVQIIFIQKESAFNRNTRGHIDQLLELLSEIKGGRLYAHRLYAHRLYAHQLYAHMPKEACVSNRTNLNAS